MVIKIGTKQFILLSVFLLFLAGLYWYVSTQLYLFNKKEQFTKEEVIKYAERVVVETDYLSSISYYRQRGENGVREVKYEEVYDADGKVIKTTTLSEKVKKAPKEQIRARGTASLETVRANVRKAVKAFCSSWKDGKWAEIIKLSSNLSGYSEGDLSTVGKDIAYQVLECVVESNPYVTNNAYGTGGKEFPMTVRVPMILKTASFYTATSSASSNSYTLEGKYDSKVKQWRFVFPGPVKAVSPNQTKTFEPGRGKEELGGSVTLEQVIIWNNTIYFIASGKFSDGTPIRNMSFRDMTEDDEGQTYSSLGGDQGLTFVVGEEKIIRVLKGFRPYYSNRDVLVKSVGVTIYRVTSQASSDFYSTDGPVYSLPIEARLTFESIKL